MELELVAGFVGIRMEPLARQRLVELTAYNSAQQLSGVYFEISLDHFANS